jgi:hypothetical protein
MDDRGKKLHAAMIREKLLVGVPPDSTLREIIMKLPDEEILRKD